MTAAQLLVYIGTAILLQLLAGAALVVWRRRVPNSGPLVSESPDIAEVSTGAWAGWRDFRVVRRVFEDAARTQCSFYLHPVDDALLAPFQPGQYLTFSLKATEAGGAGPGGARAITRCYSLSDRPDLADYRITVKRAVAPAGRPELPPGLMSGHFHDRVLEGDLLRVKAPAGQFFIDPDASVPAVFIAGGIGITPMMSMLLWCVVEQPDRLIHLYYGVRSSADHAFKDTLEDLAATHPALKLNVVYGSPEAGDRQMRDYQHLGNIDLALLRRTLPHGRHRFYVCGPPPMMQSLVPALREWGVHADEIRVEAFGPASVRTTAPQNSEHLVSVSPAIDVRFSRSGRTLVWDGQDANLLDFAERHDLPVESGCRSGSCGACQTRLLSGVVNYADKPDHDIPKGHCLLCVGKPKSALVLDA